MTDTPDTQAPGGAESPEQFSERLYYSESWIEIEDLIRERDAQIRTQALEEAARALTKQANGIRSRHRPRTHLPIADGLEKGAGIIRALGTQEPDHD